MTGFILTYVGTVLIALEFIRGAKIITGIKNIQALGVMLLAWPFKPYLNAMSSKHKSTELKGTKHYLSFLLILYALIFFIIMIPITIVFYLFYVIIALPEAIHALINKLYQISLKEYRPTYGFWTRIALQIKKSEGVNEKKVIKKLQETEIPVLPIIGLVLITIGLIVQII